MPFLYDLAARALKVSGLVVTACSAPWFGLLLCRGFGGPHAVYLPFSYFPLALLSRRFHSFPSAPGLRGVDVLLISDPTTDAHFLKNCTGPAPRPWSRCEMRDGDCDACRQPLLAGLSPVAKITLSGVPTLVSSAKAAQAVIKGLGNGSDLISFDSPTTGLHTSMFCRDLNTSRFIRNPHLQLPLGAPPGIASSTSANVLCPPPACRPQERSGWLTRSRSLRSPSLPAQTSAATRPPRLPRCTPSLPRCGGRASTCAATLCFIWGRIPRVYLQQCSIPSYGKESLCGAVRLIACSLLLLGDCDPMVSRSYDTAGCNVDTHDNKTVCGFSFPGSSLP